MKPYPCLEGRAVLVTGGATGIGATISERFAEIGARPVILDIAEKEGRALADRLTGARFVRQDLTEVDALRHIAKDIVDELGAPAALINNAAWDQRHEFPAVSPENWDASMSVNLRQVFFMCQAVAPHMRAAGGGSIINIVSLAGEKGAFDMLLYATAKAGVTGLTRSLARGLGADRIRVNAIAPGLVMTGRQRRLWHDEVSEAGFVARQAIPDPVPPRAIADAALFLASSQAAFITRQVLAVDGGVV